MISRECNNYHVMIMLIMIVGVFTETPRWGECCGLYCVCILHQRSTLYLNALQIWSDMSRNSGATCRTCTVLYCTRVPILESNVMSGPEKIRSRGSWSHIVSKATDA